MDDCGCMSIYATHIKMSVIAFCVSSLGIYFWEHLELRNLANVSLGTLPRGTFYEGFEEILHYGMMRCLMSVCLSVRSCHLLLGIPRLSKFGKCDPWQILRIYFFQNFKISKIGFLANFFTFFLKNGAVFLWTHVQSWNCGEIMRGCLMKCIFFGRFSKISKLDFWRFFLWKSRESLVSNEITTRFLNQSELQWRLSLKNVVSSMKINIFNNSNTNDTTSSLQFRRLLLFQK